MQANPAERQVYPECRNRGDKHRRHGGRALAEFLIGPAGFKRKRAIQGIFELIEVIYPAECTTIRRIADRAEM
jgi:hypothetical protein